MILTTTSLEALSQNYQILGVLGGFAFFWDKVSYNSCCPWMCYVLGGWCWALILPLTNKTLMITGITPSQLALFFFICFLFIPCNPIWSQFCPPPPHTHTSLSTLFKPHFPSSLNGHCFMQVTCRPLGWCDIEHLGSSWWCCLGSHCQLCSLGHRDHQPWETVDTNHKKLRDKEQS